MEASRTERHSDAASGWVVVVCCVLAAAIGDGLPVLFQIAIIKWVVRWLVISSSKERVERKALQRFGRPDWVSSY